MLVIYKQTKEDLERDLEKNRQLQRRGELMRYGSYAIGGWAAQPLLAALFGIGSFVDPLWDPDVAGVGLYEDVMKATVLNEVEVQRRLFDAHDQYRAIDCDRLCGWDYLQRWSRITEGRRVLKEE